MLGQDREALNDFRADSALAPVVPILERILDGNRDLTAVTGLDDPTQRAVVSTVLYFVGMTPTR
jgi:hypothetical protein